MSSLKNMAVDRTWGKTNHNSASLREVFLQVHGIWQDAAMWIRIIHWNPHLPHNSDIFGKKQKKYLILVIKQLLNILKNIKAEEIDCF